MPATEITVTPAGKVAGLDLLIPTGQEGTRFAHIQDWLTAKLQAKRPQRDVSTRVLVKGTFELIHVGGMTIGRATYEPGWKWSEHVGPSVGATRCAVEHVGLVLSGAATAAFDDGRVVELRAGQAFHIPAVPHDSWVIGDEPYVSLHFMGAEHYATK